MTKTIIAIGLGLLAAIFVPAQAVLSQSPPKNLFPVAVTGGADGEALEVLLWLLVGGEADCAVDGELLLQFPETGRVVSHEVRLSEAAPLASAVTAFAPERGVLREKVVVSLGISRAAFEGLGGCSLSVGLSWIDGRTGETHAAADSAGVVVVCGDGLCIQDAGPISR